MTLDELIERLQEIREDIGSDVPVRGVQQPNYPLLAQIEALTTIYRGGTTEVFIALADARDYGTRDHYADDFISLDPFCDDCGGFDGDCCCEREGVNA